MTLGARFSADLAGGLLAGPESHIVLAEWSDPGGGHDPPRFIAPLHVHHSDDEAWYVIEGVLVLRAADRDIAVPAGGAVIVPRGTPHTYWNPGGDPTRYLLVMTPRIRSLVDALHALGERAGRAGRGLRRPSERVPRVALIVSRRRPGGCEAPPGPAARRRA